MAGCSVGINPAPSVLAQSVHSSDGFGFKSLFDVNVCAGHTLSLLLILWLKMAYPSRDGSSYSENEDASSIFIYSSWVVRLCFKLIANVSMLTYSQ